MLYYALFYHTNYRVATAQTHKNFVSLNVINSDVQNVKQFTKMPAISDELYAELVKEFNQDSYYFFNDSYNLED